MTVRILPVVWAGLLCVPIGVSPAAWADDGPSAEDVTAAARKIDYPEGRRGGQLRLPIQGMPVTLNPLVGLGNGGEIYRLVYESLFDHDPVDNSLRPALAETLPKRLDEDGRRWRIVLRKDLHWSDGKPLTADDVVFTLQSIVFDPLVHCAFRRHWLPYGVADAGDALKRATVKAVDRRTVRIELPWAWAWLGESLAATPVFPRHVVEPALKDGTFVKPVWSEEAARKFLVGAGPFVLDTIEAKRGIALVRNERYYLKDDAGRRLPYLDGVSFSRVESPDEAQVLFLTGELDAAEVRAGDAARMIELAAEMGFNLLRRGPSGSDANLVFNLNPRTDEHHRAYVSPHLLTLFADVRFRRAVSLAIDRKAIAQTLYKGHVSIEGLPERDLDSAGELLDAMGLDERNAAGVRIDAERRAVSFMLLAFEDHPVGSVVAPRIAADLKAIGLDVTVHAKPPRDWIRARVARWDWESTFLYLPSHPVGHPLFKQRGVWHSWGWGHVWNPRAKAAKAPYAWEAAIDGKVAAGRKAFEPDARDRLYREIVHVAREKAVVIPLFRPRRMTVVASRFGNLKPTLHRRYDIRYIFDTRVKDAAEAVRTR